jgi:hypothetical protein
LAEKHENNNHDGNNMLTQHFSYETDSQSLEVSQRLASIESRIKKTLIFAYLNGKDLVEIREILDRRFVKWLNSQDWPYSDRSAYNFITIYENCTAQGLDESDLDNIQIGYTKIHSLLTGKNNQAGKDLLAMAKSGVVVTEESAEKLIKETKKAQIKRKFIEPETPISKPGCRSCSHYKIHYGREKCLYYDEHLSKLDTIDANEGCENIIRQKTRITDNQERSQIKLSPECWEKVLTQASIQETEPDTYVEDFLISGAERINYLEFRIKELEEENERLKKQHNYLLMESNTNQSVTV